MKKPNSMVWFPSKSMRILQLHCDEVEYKPVKKEIPSAEDASTDRVTIGGGVVLLLISVERGDDADPAIINQVASDAAKTSKQIGCSSFVVYPYAHLSSDLASPGVARKVLSSIEETLASLGLNVHHVPFGWNKALTMKVKGHPLAEQSKVYHPGQHASPTGETSAQTAATSEPDVITKQKEGEDSRVSTALKAEEKLKSEWFIIDTEGKLTPVGEFDFSGHRTLERLKDYETAKVRSVQQIPPHVTLMKKLGISDYEPASDPGNMRYYPKGRMIKSLLERYVTQRIQEYGGVEVETPLMYDLEHPSLASYLNRFPARQYLVKSDEKEYFLRFAACFGQFLIAKDIQLTYKQLPLKLYELTRYSFRREKSGELVGLRRLRAFTMPDCHAIVRDMQQAKEEFPKRFRLSQSVLEGVGFSSHDYELAMRFTEDFYNENREFIASILKLHGRPALVEMWRERFFYFVLKWEFNFIDNLDKASALSTDQIDIENAQRYGITFVDESGKKQTPMILHNSPSGAIERCIFGLLEKAAMQQKQNKTPELPIWLCPTQIRFIPVSQKFVELAESMAVRSQARGVRADVDDREESVGKRIRDSEREWVPFTIVIGDKEAADQTRLSVRVRGKKEGENVVELSEEQLTSEVAQHLKGKPNSPLPLPMLLSRRPYFESIT